MSMYVLVIMQVNYYFFINTPTRSDFDGDEMNVHAPQSLECIAELNELSSVSNNLVSAQSNKPVNSLVQDAISSVRKFTKRDNFLNREQVMQMMMFLDATEMPPPCIFKPIPLWSGKQIFSLFLPKINFTGYHSTHPDVERDECISIGDTRVIIQNGELIAGMICKKTVGTSSGGVLHIIFNDYGPKEAMKFLDYTSQTLNHWMLHHGFSVGIGDSLIDQEINDKIQSNYIDISTEINKIRSDFTNGTLLPKGNFTTSETKEINIQQLLAKARDTSGKLVNKSHKDQNNIKQMVDSGAKGSIMNICQISACVGQQVLEGSRLPNGFKQRTLPHYPRNDDSPESKGILFNF
jgi:DNA-directed RNA polymerase II subunit RPB1